MVYCHAIGEFRMCMPHQTLVQKNMLLLCRYYYCYSVVTLILLQFCYGSFITIAIVLLQCLCYCCYNAFITCFHLDINAKTTISSLFF